MATIECVPEDVATLQRLAQCRVDDPWVEAMARAYLLMKDMDDKTFEASVNWLRDRRAHDCDGAPEPEPHVPINEVH